MNGFEVLRSLGTARVVGAPLAARASGRPPGGAWVRRGHWALNAALGRAPEAEVLELSGLWVVRAREPRDLTLWTPAGVVTRRVAAGGELELRGDPVLLLADGRGTPAPGEPPGPVDVLAGPDLDRLPRDCFRRFLEGPWCVSPASDRVGVRLIGPALGAPTALLPSGPMTLGAVQLPPDGQPIVFGPDHPITGGYPLLAVIPPYACDVLFSVPVGGPVPLRVVDLAEARARWRRWAAHR